MPLRGGRLTPQEHRFAEAYASTGDVAYSARKAGYKDASGGHHAVHRPAVGERIAALREARVVKSLGLAFDTIDAVMLDRKARNADRVAAADKAFKVGHVYQPAAMIEKTLENMTVNEIDQDANRQIMELLELRPGEFAPAPTPAPPPEPVPDEGIFG